MKRTRTLTLVFTLLAAPGAWARADRQVTPPEGDYSVIARDEHSRTIAHVIAETNVTGAVTWRTNTYREIATSMHVRRGGEWVEARPEIRLTANGAAATNAAHSVYFPGNIGAGDVTLVASDGNHFRSRIYGLSLFDGTNAVLIGAIRDAVGHLFDQSRIVYTNAFDNLDGLEADVEYVITLAGLEQNVILRRVPSPAEFGLGADARLQLLTEFFEAPEAEKQVARVLDLRMSI